MRTPNRPVTKRRSPPKSKVNLRLLVISGIVTVMVTNGAQFAWQAARAATLAAWWAVYAEGAAQKEATLKQQVK